MEETTEVKEVTNEDLLEALQSLNETSVATNNSVKELMEYMITKDRQEQQAEATAKKQSEEAAAEAEAKAEQETKEAESAQAEADARAEQESLSQEEYQEELLYTLHSIDDGIQFNNQLHSAEVIYFGIIFGLLFIKIFFDRLYK